MIAYFEQKSNRLNDKINRCKADINEIKNLSSILEVTNIENIDTNEESYDILNEILEYEKTLTINNYSSLICPNCKKENKLHFHKTYSRNIIFTVGSYLITAKIKLIVLECTHCKQNPNTQHFHTLFLPSIFPYHIYSEGIILESLNDKIINNNKIKDIENKYKIAYQLLYYWLKIMSKYQMACSIIFKIPSNLINILNYIKQDETLFLKLFYQKYFHPFFLFKRTCVPLAITP